MVKSLGICVWIFIGRTDAEAETPIRQPPDVKLTHWKRPWCWERLKAGEGDDREWDVWTASRTWVWVSSRSWWWTGKPDVLQSMGLQRVRHDWATELNWYVSLTLVNNVELFFKAVLSVYTATSWLWENLMLHILNNTLLFICWILVIFFCEFYFAFL